MQKLMDPLLVFNCVAIQLWFFVCPSEDGGVTSWVSDRVKSELFLHVSLWHVSKCRFVIFQQLEDGGQLLTLHPWRREDKQRLRFTTAAVKRIFKTIHSPKGLLQFCFRWVAQK